MILAALAIGGCSQSSTLAAQTFLPPTSSPTGFWNATPLASAPSGGPDWPNQAYLGIRMSGVSWGSAIETSGPPVYPADPTLDFSGVDAYTNHGGNFLYTFLKVPTWANSSHTTYMAPSDIDTATDCQWISATPVKDCTFKVFVTYFMNHICPTKSTCKIRNFEAWNEFSSNGYWDDTWQHLATMAEDASIIVGQKCSNCQFGMGSVSAGGLGYNDNETTTNYPGNEDSNAHWTYYDEALGDVLKDWKSDMSTVTGLQEPDFISWHAYSAYNTDATGGPLSPQPMPEYSVSGDGTGTGGNNGDYYCSNSNKSQYTNKYCSESVLTQASTIAGMVASSTYGVQDKAIWVTEGGFDALVAMSNTDNNDGVDANPKPACTGLYDPVCTADVIRSAYLARWLILLRYSGVNRAYWYSWDSPCFGTEFGMGTETLHGSVGCTTTYGKPEVYTPYNSKTRAGTTWDQVQLWLNGASIPTGCAENMSTHIYSCTITRTNPTGYTGLIVWYTTWLGTTSYTPPAGYTQYRKVSSPTPVAYSTGSVTLGAEPIIFEKKS